LGGHWPYAVVDEDQWNQLRDQVRFFLFFLASTLIDGIALVLWVAIQAVASRALDWLLRTMPLAGLDAGVLAVLQVGFALTTLTPFALFVFLDVRRAWRRARQRPRRLRTRVVQPPLPHLDAAQVAKEPRGNDGESARRS
jgi:hypothetical protein